jgi:hypothetical protein
MNICLPPHREEAWREGTPVSFISQNVMSSDAVLFRPNTRLVSDTY